MTSDTPDTPFADFRLQSSVGAAPSIEVNGQDISRHCKRAVLILDRNPAQVATLQVELVGAATLEGAGIVKVILDEDQAEVPLSQAVLRFLNSVDPAELEQRALAGGMSEGPTVAFLAALKAMALA